MSCWHLQRHFGCSCQDFAPGRRLCLFQVSLVNSGLLNATSLCLCIMPGILPAVASNSKGNANMLCNDNSVIRGQNLCWPKLPSWCKMTYVANLSLPDRLLLRHISGVYLSDTTTSLHVVLLPVFGTPWDESQMLEKGINCDIGTKLHVLPTLA